MAIGENQYTVYLELLLFLSFLMKMMNSLLCKSVRSLTRIMNRQGIVVSQSCVWSVLVYMRFDSMMSYILFSQANIIVSSHTIQRLSYWEARSQVKLRRSQKRSIWLVQISQTTWDEVLTLSTQNTSCTGSMSSQMPYMHFFLWIKQSKKADPVFHVEVLWRGFVRIPSGYRDVDKLYIEHTLRDVKRIFMGFGRCESPSYLFTWLSQIWSIGFVISTLFSHWLIKMRFNYVRDEIRAYYCLHLLFDSIISHRIVMCYCPIKTSNYFGINVYPLPAPICLYLLDLSFDDCFYIIFLSLK